MASSLRFVVLLFLLSSLYMTDSVSASRLKNPTKGRPPPLKRRSQEEIPEDVRVGAWPGTLDREEGVVPGHARKGCVEPLCDPGRPDILQAGDPLVFSPQSRVASLDSTRTAADAATALEFLENALLEESSYLCSGVSPVSGAGIASGRSRFLFSRSYKDTGDDACSSSSSSSALCYAPDEQISSSTGDYTQIGLQIQVSGAAPMQGTGLLPASGQDHVFSADIDFVSSESSEGTSAGTCATYSRQCPAGVSCESIQHTVVSVTVSNIRAAYRMNRMCPSSTGTHTNAPGTGPCRLPYAYVPFDDSDASLDPDAAGVEQCYTGVFSDRDDGGAIVSTPCEPPSDAQTATPAALDVLCGSMRDPDTGLTNELNRRCAKAICGACPASGLATPSAHRRYAAGPNTYAFSLGSPDRLIGDVTVVVAVEADGLLPAGTRTVVLPSVDLDQVAMNEEGDNMVRVSVVGFRASTRLPLPDVSNGMVTVTVYDDADAPGGMIRQASSPDVNPWTTFAGNGAGLTPTSTQMGTPFSWAYYPSRARFGDVPGAYGETQEMMTSSEGEFGSSASCFKGMPVGDFYDQCQLVPGCAVGTGGTSLVDPPLVYTPCLKTHIYNTITSELLAGTVPSALTYEPKLHLFPAWNLLLPNWWPYDDYMYYQLPDAAPLRVYENAAYKEPANIFSAGSAEGATSFVPGVGNAAPSLADYVVGADDETGIASAWVGTVATAIELTVDISADLAAYTGGASAGTILAVGTGCVVVGNPQNSTDTPPLQAYATATMQNENPDDSQNFVIEVECTSVDTFTAGQLSAVSPQAVPLFITAQSIAQTPPFSFEIGSYNSTATPAKTGSVVRCTFTAFYITDGGSPFLVDSYEVPCIGAPNPDADVRDEYDIGCGDDSCYRFHYDGDGGDGEGSGDSGDTLFIIVCIIGACLLVSIAALILYAILKYRSSRKSK